MIPSIKKLDQVAPGKGRILRQLLISEDAVLNHPAAQALEQQCYGKPSLVQLRMEALNAEAEMYGVECVRFKDGSLAFEYLNTGDSYYPTIIRWSDGRYRVSSWGDIVERSGAKYQ